MPKRKLEDSDSADTPSDVNPLRSETPPPPPQSETDESSSFSAVTDSSVDVPSAEEPRPKKIKKSVNFDKVTVFYFPRTQGFTCVPSEGGSTLGMTGSHSYVEDFTVPAYAREQKRIHKLILKEQQQSSKMIPSGRAAFLRSVDEDTDSESDSESDFEVDEYFFLQPVPIRQRRLMLRAAGIRKINSQERDDCRQIRQSREICGCQCKVFCDPESCSCSVAGIKCQVDRLSFPCGCSKDGCGNVAGRIEFNPIRVRTHFIHTLMRIELENKEKECQPFGNGSNKQLSISDLSATSKERDSEEKNKEDTKNSKDSSIDLTDYNSNERGSCRDCQNSEVCQVMMQEAQYASMEAEQQNAVQQFGHMEGLQPNGHVEALPRVLLFNDSDDEMYNAENTSLYGYKQEESSYSETSECSSESSANFDDNDYQKSYQSLSSFDEETNQEYCASGSSSVGGDITHCQTSQMQQHNNNNNNNHISNNNNNNKSSSFVSSNNNNNLPNGLAQKYMDLNSSSSTPSTVYKLEPVSHLMNRLDNGHSAFSSQPNGHNRFDSQSNGNNAFDGQTNTHSGFNGRSNGHHAFAQSNGHSAFDSQNTFNTQSNSHNTFHSQSSGHSTFNGQPNGHNAFESHSNSHNAFNGQSNNHNTFNTQSSDHNTFSSQSTFGNQSNGPDPFGSQSNGSNPFSSQSNGPSLFGSQSNGTNPFGNQSNGPTLFGTQSNSHNTFESQSTQPSSHSTSNWSENQSRSIHQSSFFDEPISIYTSLTDTTTDQLATNCPAISSHMNSYNNGNSNNNHQLDFNPHQGTDTTKIGDMHNQPESAYSNYSMDDSHTATSSAMSTSDQSLISSFFPSNTTESDLITSSGSSAPSIPSAAAEDLQVFSEQESCCSAFQDDTCSDFKSNKDSSHFQPSESGSQNFGEIIKESIVETVSA